MNTTSGVFAGGLTGGGWGFRAGGTGAGVGTGTGRLGSSGGGGDGEGLGFGGGGEGEGVTAGVGLTGVVPRGLPGQLMSLRMVLRLKDAQPPVTS